MRLLPPPPRPASGAEQNFPESGAWQVLNSRSDSLSGVMCMTYRPSEYSSSTRAISSASISSSSGTRSQITGQKNG